MKVNVSDRAKAEGIEMLFEGLLARSREKFAGGVRTKIGPMRFGGRVLMNYLLSTYMGGEYAVITTRHEQWLVMSSELENADVVKERHGQIASTFAIVMEGDGGKTKGGQ